MFTGIVEEVGTVVSLELLDPDARMVIQAPLVTTDAKLGSSIAVCGVCLTVTEIDGEGRFGLDLMPETLRRSSLGELKPGDAVNLERALPATGRLDGHIVQGHVDGVGRIISRNPGERWDEVWIELPQELARYVVEKGSIAVAGVSLTVSGLGDGRFQVSLIPTTLAHTTFGGLAPGDPVNLEVDVLAKYAERLLAEVAR
jgi:riboflavin synthase